MSARRIARARRAPLVLTTAMAATLGALGGCSSTDDDWDDNYAATDTRFCVDENGQRVSDWQCDDDHFRSSGGYGWYYVGRGSRIPYYGDRIGDPALGIRGSRTPKAGAYYAYAPEATNMSRSAARQRGGFGSSSRGFGSGRS